MLSGPAAQPMHGSALAADVASRKSASVTVRLTSAEDERLRQRAVEAGMTISAYLRSCAFEVETLRAQVKQTIAEMRHADPAPQPEQKSSFSRLFPWRKRSSATGRLIHQKHPRRLRCSLSGRFKTTG